MAIFKAANIQVSSTNEMDENLAVCGDLVRQARDQGADFITTPECVSMLEIGYKPSRAKAFIETEHPAIAAFSDWAKETGAWLLAGSLAVIDDIGEDLRLLNRSYLFDPTGRTVAKYDKVHMFDVDLPSGESYRESKNYRPGEKAVLADLPWGRLGMTICYDLRFPHLYRDLAQNGAEILTIPSAFTKVTGAAHWHVLMQARAIETGCFVISAAQTGTHVKGRKSYGHSVIVAPWGEVLCDGGEEVGFSLAEIDMDRVAEARGRVPSLQHDRPITAPEVQDGVELHGNRLDAAE